MEDQESGDAAFDAIWWSLQYSKLDWSSSGDQTIEKEDTVTASDIAEYMDVSLLQGWQLIREIKKASGAPEDSNANCITRDEFRTWISSTTVDHATFRSKMSNKKIERYRKAYTSLADENGNLSLESLASLMGCNMNEAEEMVSGLRMLSMDEEREQKEEVGPITSLTFDDFVELFRQSEQVASKAFKQAIEIGVKEDFLDLGADFTFDDDEDERIPTITRRDSSIASIMSEAPVPDLVVKLWMRTDPDENGDAETVAVITMLHAAISRGDIETTEEEKLGLVFCVEEQAQRNGKLRFKDFLGLLSGFSEKSPSLENLNRASMASMMAPATAGGNRSYRHVRQLSVSSHVVQRVASIKTRRDRHFRNSEITWQAPSKTLTVEQHAAYTDIFNSASAAGIATARGPGDCNYHSQARMPLQSLQEALFELQQSSEIGGEEKEFCWQFIQNLETFGLEDLDFEQFVVLMQEASQRQKVQNTQWTNDDSLELIRSKMSREAKLVVIPDASKASDADVVPMTMESRTSSNKSSRRTAAIIMCGIAPKEHTGCMVM